MARQIYSLKDATIKLKDGTTPTAKEVEILMDDGSISITESRNIEYKMNRGVLGADTAVREGDDVPMEISITGRMDGYKGESALLLTPNEFIKNNHGSITLVTTGDECAPYACDILIEFAHPDGCDPGYDPELVELPEFRWEQCVVDIKAGTVQISGKCKAKTPTVTRPT
jgi:hypothetical protein